MVRNWLLTNVVATLAVYCFVATASADVATIVADRDNTLFQDAAGSVSNGAGANFFAGRNANGSVRRGLLYFDIAANIPAGSVIESATLSLHMSQSPNATSRVVTLHRSLADWGEGASNASAGGGGNGTAAAVGDATWLHTFYNTQTWSSIGGDFAATSSASTNVADVGDYTWSSPGMIADLQSWLDSPTGNFGWFVLADETANQTVKRFDTSENANAAFRPTLTIEYTAVPEPSSALLIATACVATTAVRRRRAA